MLLYVVSFPVPPLLKLAIYKLSAKMALLDNIRKVVEVAQTVGLTVGFGVLLLRIMMVQSEYWEREINALNIEGRPDQLHHDNTSSDDTNRYSAPETFASFRRSLLNHLQNEEADTNTDDEDGRDRQYIGERGNVFLDAEAQGERGEGKIDILNCTSQ